MNDERLLEALKAAAEQIEIMRAQLLIRRDRITSLRAGPGGIMELKQTIADKEAEIERLKAKCDKQAMILRRLTPENHPNTLFISGILGSLDQNNMPKKICVVPAYGVDFSYVYEYNGTNIVQEW